MELPTCVVLAFVLCAPIAMGSIAVGRLWDRGVHVQEYWSDGEFYYCIHNSRADSVMLTMREYWTVDVIEEQESGITLHISGGRSVTGDTLAVLDLAPGEFARMPAPRLPGGRLVQFHANGARMGLAPAYYAPLYGSRREIAIRSNLDSPGCRQDGFWTEHSSLWVGSGEEFTVDLVFAEGTGKTRIDKSPGRIPEDFLEDELLVPYDVVSASLEVAESPEEFTIFVSESDLSEEPQRVKLYFRAPKVEDTTLMVFGGFRWSGPGTGHSIERVVWVGAEGAGGLPSD
jgi:hypothetical protein